MVVTLPNQQKVEPCSCGAIPRAGRFNAHQFCLDNNRYHESLLLLFKIIFYLGQGLTNGPLPLPGEYKKKNTYVHFIIFLMYNFKRSKTLEYCFYIVVYLVFVFFLMIYRFHQLLNDYRELYTKFYLRRFFGDWQVLNCFKTNIVCETINVLKLGLPEDMRLQY